MTLESPDSPISILEERAHAKRGQFRTLVEDRATELSRILLDSYNAHQQEDEDKRPLINPMADVLADAAAAITAICFVHNAAVETAVMNDNPQAAAAWAMDEGKLSIVLSMIDNLALTV